MDPMAVDSEEVGHREASHLDATFYQLYRLGCPKVRVPSDGYIFFLFHIHAAIQVYIGDFFIVSVDFLSPAVQGPSADHYDDCLDSHFAFSAEGPGL